MLRVLPHPEPGRDAVREFRSFCHIAKLSEKLFGNGQDMGLRDASKQSFFNSPTITNITKTFATYPFPVAFQLESLIRNGLMTTNDLKQLITFIKLKDICKRHPEHECQYAAGLLQDYRVKLLASSQPSLADLADPAARAEVEQLAQSRVPTHRECLESVLKNYQPQTNFVSPSSFLCHHITVTPSRFILRGPYPTLSNRIIRRFKGFEHHFIRVDFSDEDNDRLALGREVNNRPYLHTRVGAVLTTGFSLGARHFELLGYSSSSIRNKSVWFINPFEHPKYGRVDGTSIRRSIIDYSGKSLSEEKRERNDVLLTQPSKYAARIALAFTSTECSVKIHRSEWKEISDLGTDPYLHTDGAGTMSTALRDRIWVEMCREDPERMIREMPPSVVSLFVLMPGTCVY
jgi:RNA-dependent RNA polymerase